MSSITQRRSNDLPKEPADSSNSGAVRRPKGASRTSALEHLQRLPDVFDMGHFCLQANIAPASAKVMLSRWAAQGLIAHAGPHAGIYYKRLAPRDTPDEQRACAILSLYPGAVVQGPSVLHAHGWTTQIPRQLHIAAPNDSRVVQLFEVDIYWRPRRWFIAMHEHKTHALDAKTELLQKNEASGENTAWNALKQLTPAWALVDLLRYQDGWQPDPDDLDIPESSHAAILQAADTLGLDHSRLEPYGISQDGDGPQEDYQYAGEDY